MTYPARVGRPTVDSDLEEAHTRIRALEGVNAILYDTFNDGGFLDVVTSSYTQFTSSDGFVVQALAGGVNLSALNTGPIIVEQFGVDGIQIQNLGDGGTLIEDDGAGIIQIFSNNRVELDGGEIDLSAGGLIFLNSFGGSIVLHTDAHPIFLYAQGGTTTAMIQMRLDSGNYFTIGDNVPNVFFRVQETGTFIFNLPTSNPGVTGQLWNSAGTVKIA